MLGSSIQIGSPNIVHSISAINMLDDILLTLGSDNDVSLHLNSAGFAANTAVGTNGTLVGTPVGQAVAANSLVISNITANGDIALYGNLGGNSQQFLFYDTSASILYLGNGANKLLQVDGANMAIGLGSAAVTTANVTHNFPARTITAAANYSRLFIGSTNAITVNTGTVPVLATLYLKEPNITIGTGAVTKAVTFCIEGAPTEGSENYAFYVADGTSYFNGNIGLRSTPSNYSTLYSTLSEWMNTDENMGRNGSYFSLTLNKTTQAWTQNQQVIGGYFIGVVGASNNQNWTQALGLVGVRGDIRSATGATGTITGGTSLLASASNWAAATLTNRYGVYVANAVGAGTITNQYGIYFEALDKGASLNYMIHGATDITFGMGINIASGKTYQIGGTQVVGARVVDARIDDAIDSGDATTDGVIDACRSALIAHGLCTAS